MDGVRLLAARLWIADRCRTFGVMSAPRRRPQGRRRMIRQGPGEGRQPEGVWKTAARGVCLVETVNLRLRRARPGCPAPSPSTRRVYAAGREPLPPSAR